MKQGIWLLMGTTFLITVFPATAAGPGKGKAERGAYLVRIGGCNDCHTPLQMGPEGPEPVKTKLLSGHPEAMKMPPAPNLGQGPWVWAGAGSMTAFSGPWGVSFSANLTPDKETGLGSWTETTFIQALRNCRIGGTGRKMLPPMPCEGIAGATDDDLKAIFAYLKSIPSVKNKVPAPIEPSQPAK